MRECVRIVSFFLNIWACFSVGKVLEGYFFYFLNVVICVIYVCLHIMLIVAC